MRKLSSSTSKYYAVKTGRVPGIYQSWPGCKQQVHQFSGAVFKAFTDLGEAESFLRGTPPGGSRDGSRPLTQEGEQLAAAPASTATYRLEFDGASRGNPGRAGAGAVLIDEATDAEVGCVCSSLGTATNNVAEYSGLIKGLQAAVDMGVKHLRVAGDSALVINQMNDVWKVRHAGLIPLHSQAEHLKQQFRQISFQHIYREDNKLADRLSNQAIDEGGWDGLRNQDPNRPAKRRKT